MAAEQLAVGARAIAELVGLRPRIIYTLAEQGLLPTFRVGHRLVASPTALAAWKQRRLDEAERKVAA